MNIETTDAARVFSERMAYHTEKGLTGAAVYNALAVDPHLPAYFGPADYAAILGVTRHTVVQHRARGTGPDYLKPTTKQVLYPRAEFVRWLASKLVRVK